MFKEFLGRLFDHFGSISVKVDSFKKKADITLDQLTVETNVFKENGDRMEKSIAGVFLESYSLLSTEGMRIRDGSSQINSDFETLLKSTMLLAQQVQEESKSIHDTMLQRHQTMVSDLKNFYKASTEKERSDFGLVFDKVDYILKEDYRFYEHALQKQKQEHQDIVSNLTEKMQLVESQNAILQKRLEADKSSLKDERESLLQEIKDRISMFSQKIENRMENNYQLTNLNMVQVQGHLTTNLKRREEHNSQIEQEYKTHLENTEQRSFELSASSTNFHQSLSENEQSNSLNLDRASETFTDNHVLLSTKVYQFVDSLTNTNQENLSNLQCSTAENFLTTENSLQTQSLLLSQIEAKTLDQNNQKNYYLNNQIQNINSIKIETNNYKEDLESHLETQKSELVVEYKYDLPTGKTPRKKQRVIKTWERTRDHGELIVEFYEEKEGRKDTKLPKRKRDVLHDVGNEMVFE
jgi:hypothetical protein